MKYNAPAGSKDPEAPYSNGIPGQVKGSPINANAVEYPQREIINVITAAGLTPTNDELDQLLRAIRLIAGGSGGGGGSGGDGSGGDGSGGAASGVRAPFVLAPAEGSKNIDPKPVIALSAFEVADGEDAPAGTRVQIARDTGFTDVAYDSGWVAYTVLHGVTERLELDTAYFIRAAHKGSALGEGPWSARRGFRTTDFVARVASIDAVLSVHGTHYLTDFKSLPDGSGYIGVFQRYGYDSGLCKFDRDFNITDQKNVTGKEGTSLSPIFHKILPLDNGEFLSGTSVLATILNNDLSFNRHINKNLVDIDTANGGIIKSAKGDYVILQASGDGVFQSYPRSCAFLMDSNFNSKKLVRFEHATVSSSYPEIASILPLPNGGYLLTGVVDISGYGKCGVIFKLTDTLSITEAMGFGRTGYALKSACLAHDGGYVVVGRYCIVKVSEDLAQQKIGYFPYAYMDDLHDILATPDGGYLAVNPSHGVIIKFNNDLQLERAVQIGNITHGQRKYGGGLIHALDGGYVFWNGYTPFTFKFMPEDLMTRTPPCLPGYNLIDITSTWTARNEQAMSPAQYVARDATPSAAVPTRIITSAVVNTITAISCGV